jgi:ribosomal protein S18 acetylase RimI-like enzyme
MSTPLPSGVDFRPMRPNDVSAVLEIIRLHDDDDYEEARETYRESLEGQFVLTKDGRVVGSTGAEYAEETDNNWWLSWTYLAAEFQGSGLGAVMLVKMLDQLREWEARKVFVSTSDYVDLQQGEVYRDALKAYQRLGFQEELRHKDYYERNEAQIALGLRLAPDPVGGGVHPEPDMRAAVVLGFGEVPEAEDAAAVDWEFADTGSPTQELEDLVQDAARQGARVVFASAPSDASRVMSLFKSAGFVEEGRLLDFYEDGIDDVHFRYDVR